MNRGVVVKLDRRRRLRYTVESVGRLELEAGVTLQDLGEALREAHPSAFIVAAWAALIADDPELTISRVRDLIEPGHVPGLVKALRRALRHFERHVSKMDSER